jgi:hypothetical protein
MFITAAVFLTISMLAVMVIKTQPLRGPTPVSRPRAAE